MCVCACVCSVCSLTLAFLTLAFIVPHSYITSTSDCLGDQWNKVFISLFVCQHKKWKWLSVCLYTVLHLDAKNNNLQMPCSIWSHVTAWQPFKNLFQRVYRFGMYFYSNVVTVNTAIFCNAKAKPQKLDNKPLHVSWTITMHKQVVLQMTLHLLHYSHAW